MLTRSYLSESNFRYTWVTYRIREPGTALHAIRDSRIASRHDMVFGHPSLITSIISKQAQALSRHGSARATNARICRKAKRRWNNRSRSGPCKKREQGRTRTSRLRASCSRSGYRLPGYLSISLIGSIRPIGPWTIASSRWKWPRIFHSWQIRDHLSLNGQSHNR